MVSWCPLVYTTYLICFPVERVVSGVVPIVVESISLPGMCSCPCRFSSLLTLFLCPSVVLLSLSAYHLCRRHGFVFGLLATDLSMLGSYLEGYCSLATCIYVLM
ncbi:hypothetical protein R3P38DRAFT_3076885 [Favolaschia claudopus]|uniref:Uncharacterized protein n=1 Tax=Favolaschia claudopus TaxID=2862362 RepID=A0AAV9ZX91_9AGAR